MENLPPKKQLSPNAYRPEYRIKKKSDFKRMEKAQIRLHTRAFLLILTPSLTTETRLGLVVTKKIDKRAVVRNKIRRRMREIFRVVRSNFREPYDVLAIARKSAKECPFAVIKKQVNAALWQHGFLNDRKRQENNL